MSPLADFLQHLFECGTITYREPPVSPLKEDREAVQLLERAFGVYRLHVAGPGIAFARETALAAAEVVRHAGWFLFSRQEPEAELDKRLVLPALSATPADHLSADLTLRYLPTIHRRAYALAPADHLVMQLAGLLRQWPLSGVLSAVEEGPETWPDFQGHPGLHMLYAERLAENEKLAWIPQGKALEYVELVYAGLGRRVPQRLVPNPRDEEKEDAHV